MPKYYFHLQRILEIRIKIWDEMLLIWFLQLLDCVKIQAGIVSHRRVAVEGSMSTKNLLTSDRGLGGSPGFKSGALGPSNFIFKLTVLNDFRGPPQL